MFFFLVSTLLRSRLHRVDCVLVDRLFICLPSLESAAPTLYLFYQLFILQVRAVWFFFFFLYMLSLVRLGLQVWLMCVVELG